VPSNRALCTTIARVEIVGVVPAAGYATRMQPLACSKEVYEIDGRPVMDYLVDRMRIGGCTDLRVVTRPEKEDVITHARALGATVILARPATVSDSLLGGMDGLEDDDVVLIGFPDTLWEPDTGYGPLVEAVRAGCDVALGLFRTGDLRRSDVVAFDDSGGIAGIEVKPEQPPSEWIWGCAAARAQIWRGLAGTGWPGSYVDRLCRSGRDVRGVKLSDTWLDVGTRESLRQAAAATWSPGRSPR
jgi:glucose-1-phosphate thymidylyltransferase